MNTHDQENILLALFSGRKWGREISLAIETEVGKRPARGWLYTTLDRLEKAGLVRSEREEQGQPGGGAPRVYYALTGEGEGWLRRREDERRRLSGGLSGLVGGAL
ncbi:MAG: PadR family transcriptional regulator [Planctomycetota bacterium]